ncbi:DUF4190 domain-containing protein [Coralloluteibacterium thermophilus]|uniref:DUF4190 domain-containing protein n=1 Tax=Coralloluteibacterium thermophilum TaxID=2707049 RepID=A0ABV9NP49_9GAMM
MPPVPATPAPTHSGAVVSLVFGVLSWLLIPFIGALVAVVAGHLARRDIRAAGGRLQGDGLALGGLVLGWVQLVSLFLGALLIGGLLLLGGTALLLGFLL